MEITGDMIKIVRDLERLRELQCYVATNEAEMMKVSDEKIEGWHKFLLNLHRYIRGSPLR